jgi:hypothetical protein
MRSGTSRRSDILLGPLGFLLVFGVGASGQCDRSVTAPGGASLRSIRAGTGFGRCAGYCYDRLEIDGSGAQYVQQAELHERFRFPDRHATFQFGAREWSDLAAAVNRDRLLRLPDRIDCAGCADQGAEWVEVTFTDRRRKTITYDFGRPPDELRPLAKKLSELRARLASEWDAY